ncbi:MAG: flagellar protein FliS [Muribaculaceae bacterium]|nr:flagellar protein FliS [Roseburia sp.]MCM1430914.1 flagellar protein FliS [Muribaculaceae bacterium]MCM1491725.1 flagellar protein FliS [Muribaculaceae bacterium]
MDNSLKRDFTRRLSQCNQGEMIVIIYDIFFAYTNDAEQALAVGDRQAVKEAVRGAQRTLDELIGALDFSYGLSKNLYALYVFCKNELARTLYQNSGEGLVEAKKVMGKLHGSFIEAARQDRSRPLMRNTQQVYAGITYGRAVLNESYMDMDTQRGFFV